MHFMTSSKAVALRSVLSDGFGVKGFEGRRVKKVYIPHGEGSLIKGRHTRLKHPE